MGLGFNPHLITEPVMPTLFALSICGSVVSTHRTEAAALRAVKGRPQPHVYQPDDAPAARREAKRNRR